MANHSGQIMIMRFWSFLHIVLSEHFCLISGILEEAKFFGISSLIEVLEDILEVKTELLYVLVN